MGTNLLDNRCNLHAIQTVLTSFMSVEYSLHRIAGIAIPLQQVQSHPQQMSARSQVHFEHIIFNTRVVVDVFFVLKTIVPAFMLNICIW
jgi:hypothetical protein